MIALKFLLLLSSTLLQLIQMQSIIEAPPSGTELMQDHHSHHDEYHHHESSPMMGESINTLQCLPKTYTYRVTQRDQNGKQCWDTVSVKACWGRCDSNEIADWRFPYKKSKHPVCVHYGRNRLVTELRNCETGALPLAREYEYLEAAACRCQLCSSSDTSCEGLRYRPQRSSDPDHHHLGFHIN